MKPLVSILIPAYNAERLLAETLESALAQTWPRTEVILVDDGSTDGTLSVARRYESRNLRVVTQANQGAAAARNKALSLSQGDYIQWLDADDLLAKDKITRQMDARDRCASTRTLLSSSWAQFMFRQSRATFSPTPLWTDLSPAEWLFRKLGQNLHMQTSTWLVSRELTEAAGEWNCRLVADDDGEYFCRVLLKSDGVKFIPESKVFYRSPMPGSLSYIGASSPKIESQFLSMSLHISYLRSLEDSERVRQACLTYLQLGLPLFYPERPDVVERAMALAAELGGTIEIPKLSPKYSWISLIAGPQLAKHAQRSARSVRWSMSRSIDRALWWFERTRLSA